MKKLALIKLGGLVAQDSQVLQKAFQDMKSLRDQWNFVLVHGGGKEVSELSKKLGFQVIFQEGLRVTRPEEMDIVGMVLSGKVNSQVVRLGQSLGLRTLGLSGYDDGIFTGEALQIPGYPGSRTGKITQTKGELLKLLLQEGYLPVLSSVSNDAQGEALNINADEAALAVAQCLGCNTLIFISDIPGILKNGEILRHMNEIEVLNEIEEKVIQGGMIPKVRSSIEALKTGVGQVVIGGYEKPQDLVKLLEGSLGTHLTLV